MRIAIALLVCLRFAGAAATTCTNNTTVSYNGVTLREFCNITFTVSVSGQTLPGTGDMLWKDTYTGSDTPKTIVFLPGTGFLLASVPKGLGSCNDTTGSATNQAYDIASGTGSAAGQTPSVVICPNPSTLAVWYRFSASVSAGWTSATLQQAPGNAVVNFFPNITGTACTDCTYAASYELAADQNNAQQEIFTVTSQDGANNKTIHRTDSNGLAHTVSTPTGNTASGSQTITSVSSTTNILAGMDLQGTGIQGGSVVLSVTANTIVMSRLASSTNTGVTVTVSPMVTMPKATYPAGLADIAGMLSWMAETCGQGTYPCNPNDIHFITTSSGSHDAQLVAAVGKTRFLNSSEKSWWGSHGATPSSSHTSTAWTVKSIDAISGVIDTVMMIDCQISGCATATANGYNLIATYGCNAATSGGSPANAINTIGTDCNTWVKTIRPLAFASTIQGLGVNMLVQIGSSDQTTPPEQLAPWQALWNSLGMNYLNISGGFHGLGGCYPNGAAPAATCWTNVVNHATAASYVSATKGVTLNGVTIQ